MPKGATTPPAPDTAAAAMSGNQAETPARTRFAPSPTGMQHIGGFRTALFSWLLARHTGGQFLLRIEDTDLARTQPGSVENVLEGFKWLGMDIDEGPENGGPYGPYYQTQRRDIYQPYAEQLIESGAAYRCFCTKERLDQVTKMQEARHLPPHYDRHCRNLTKREITKNLKEGLSFTVRLAVPLDGKTFVYDILRGQGKEPIVFENANLADAILLKSDGYPTYHLASVIDDHLMRITHVLRAEEWIPSSPLHVLTYKALSWEPPIFAHVPDILAPVGQQGKLSKRKGAVPMTEYASRGYLPEAVLNYMALLGWSYDDKETILSREQLIQAFSLDRVGLAPSRYDESRLNWFNGYYIRQLSADTLLDRVLPFLERAEAEGGLPDSISRPLNRDYTKRVLLLEQERMKTLAEAPEMTAFFYVEKLEYPTETLIAKHMDAAKTLDGLQRTQAILEAQENWVAAEMEPPLRELVTELGLKPVQLFTSLRVAVTGRTVSPPLFETMETMGRTVSLARLKQAITALAAHNSAN